MYIVKPLFLVIVFIFLWACGADSKESKSSSNPDTLNTVSIEKPPMPDL